MKINQKGFGLVEILIVIVIVGLLVAMGWLVYSRSTQNQTQTDSKQTSANPDISTDATSNPTNYLTLTDFNVRIPLDDKTDGLKLGSVSSAGYNETDKSVAIIAPELDNAWKCEANPDGDFKGTIGMISITTQATRPGPSEPLVSKRVGDYTFGFEPGGANCTDSPQYQQLIDAFKIQFGKIEAN